VEEGCGGRVGEEGEGEMEEEVVVVRRWSPSLYLLRLSLQRRASIQGT
jgi:hypothetical protein